MKGDMVMDIRVIKKELIYEDIQIGDTDGFYLLKQLLSMILFNLPG